MVRTFIAVTLSAGARARLAGAANALRLAAPHCPVAWVPEANIHLTLKFLGDTSESKIPQINSALATAAAQSSAFLMRLRGTGCFPNLQYPRVVWAGIAEDDARLIGGIYRLVEQSLTGLGFQNERRPFSPHITLGRVRPHARRGESARLGEAVRAFDRHDFGDVPVGGITLVKSELQRGGSVYTPLFVANFADSGSD